MAIPSLFRLPPHKNFKFKTRYYDADKEEFEERVERAKRDAGITGAVNDKGTYVPNIKGQMKHYMNRRPSLQKARNKSSLRMIFIAIILGFIAYYFLYL